MAFVDKLKAQASQLGQKAQEAGKAGQAKMEEAKARRHADGLLRDLGAAFLAQRVGRDGDHTVEIERLVGELKTYESEHGPLTKADDGIDEAGDGA